MTFGDIEELARMLREKHERQDNELVRTGLDLAALVISRWAGTLSHPDYPEDAGDIFLKCYDKELGEELL